MPDTGPIHPVWPQSHAVATTPRHSPETTNVRGVVQFLISLMVFLAAVQLTLVGLYAAFIVMWPRGFAPPTALQAQRQAPPAPRLQVDPRGDLAVFQAREAKQLETYGWVNAAKQIAHIPIGAAMRIEAQRHAGDRPESAVPFNPSRERADRYGSSGGLTPGDRRAAGLPAPAALPPREPEEGLP